MNIKLKINGSSETPGGPVYVHPGGVVELIIESRLVDLSDQVLENLKIEFELREGEYRIEPGRIVMIMADTFECTEEGIMMSDSFTVALSSITQRILELTAEAIPSVCGKITFAFDDTQDLKENGIERKQSLCFFKEKVSSPGKTAEEVVCFLMFLEFEHCLVIYGSPEWNKVEEDVKEGKTLEEIESELSFKIGTIL